MFDLVLITTGYNRLREKVEGMPGRNKIIDCETGRVSTLDTLMRCFSDGVKVLLTYRCPYVIPEELYSKAVEGAYNIHPSLLPAYPGLNPWIKIFEDKISVSGVTLHRLDRIPDTGEIICQNQFRITEDDTLETARNKADITAVELLNYFYHDTE